MKERKGPYRIVYQVIKSGVFVEKYYNEYSFYDNMLRKLRYSKVCRLVSAQVFM